MLPRSQRLSVEQLNLVIEKGRVTHSSLFLMRSLGGQKDSRIAAVAPKKIAKTAVARNAIRRKIYEAVKGLAGEIKEGVHIVLFAKTGIETKQPESLKEDLKNLFVKAGVLR